MNFEELLGIAVIGLLVYLIVSQQHPAATSANPIITAAGTFYPAPPPNSYPGPGGQWVTCPPGQVVGWGGGIIGVPSCMSPAQAAQNQMNPVG